MIPRRCGAPFGVRRLVAAFLTARLAPSRRRALGREPQAEARTSGARRGRGVCRERQPDAAELVALELNTPYGQPSPQIELRVTKGRAHLADQPDKQTPLAAPALEPGQQLAHAPGQLRTSAQVDRAIPPAVSFSREPKACAAWMAFAVCAASRDGPRAPASAHISARRARLRLAAKRPVKKAATSGRSPVAGGRISTFCRLKPELQQPPTGLRNILLPWGEPCLPSTGSRPCPVLTRWFSFAAPSGYNGRKWPQ